MRSKTMSRAAALLLLFLRQDLTVDFRLGARQQVCFGRRFAGEVLFELGQENIAGLNTRFRSFDDAVRDQEAARQSFQHAHTETFEATVANIFADWLLEGKRRADGADAAVGHRYDAE